MDNLINIASENSVKPKRALPSLLSELAVCFALSYAAYAYYHETIPLIQGIAEPERVNSAIKIFIFALLIIFWIIISIQNGAKHRNGFLVFTIIYWLLPLIIGLLISAIPDLSNITGNAATAINIPLFFVKIITQSITAGLEIINNYIPVTNAFALCFLTGTFVFAFILSSLISAAYTSRNKNNNIINNKEQQK